MKQAKGMFDVLRARGGAVAAQVSEQLMKSPAFHDFVLRGVGNLYRGKERLSEAVGQALKTMNVPTRTEFKRAVARIDALEREVADRTRAAAPARAAKRRAPARRRKAPPARGA